MILDPTWKAAFIDGSRSLSGAAFTALDSLPTGSTPGREDVQRTERDLAEIVLALKSVNYDVADISPMQALEIQAFLGLMYTEYFGHFSASSLGIAIDRATITEVSLPGFAFAWGKLTAPKHVSPFEIQIAERAIR